MAHKWIVGAALQASETTGMVRAHSFLLIGITNKNWIPYSLVVRHALTEKE